MIHMYEIDSGRGENSWEVYNKDYDYLFNVERDEYDEFIRQMHEDGLDYVVHTVDYVDEYHLALEA